MPKKRKLRRVNPEESSCSGEDEENYSSSFRRYSEDLFNQSLNCQRQTPSMMNTPDLGSPKKVWSLLCSKDDIAKRRWSIEQHPGVKPSMRYMVVDWLMEVCSDRKLHRETFHLAVDYFDRFMSLTTDQKPQQLQLSGTTALAIASKMEEIYPPKIYDIVEYSDGACSVDQVVKLEAVMLTKLEWNFAPITSIHWLSIYLQLIAKINQTSPDTVRKIETEDEDSQASCFRDDRIKMGKSVDLASVDGINESFTDFNQSYSHGQVIVNESVSVPQLMRIEFIQLARVIDLLLLDGYFLKYKYSELAAAVMFCCYEPCEKIENVTGLNRADLAELITIVQIYVDYCEETHAVADTSFAIQDISFDDQHNIQTFETDSSSALEIIKERRDKKIAELKLIHKATKMQQQSNQDTAILKDINV